MSIEAMKQAVEAFEHIKKYVTDDGAMPENWDAYHEKEYFALEALRQAIEQAEKQEPVAWMEDSIEFYAKDHPTNSCTIPLYTAPLRKEWVGLTEEERCKCASWLHCKTINEIFDAIEAKLKERNT